MFGMYSIGLPVPLMELTVSLNFTIDFKPIGPRSGGGRGGGGAIIGRSQKKVGNP